MQLSTSFLPFDVPPATAAVPIAATGASAQTQPAPGDFGAILASEANAAAATLETPATPASPATVAGESVEETVGGEVEADIVVTIDSSASAKTSAAPVALEFTWSDSMTPSDASGAESASVLAATSTGTDITAGLAADNAFPSRASSENTAARRNSTSSANSHAIPPTSPGATSVQQRVAQPGNSESTSRAATPLNPAMSSPRAAVAEAPRDSAPQRLLSTDASATNPGSPIALPSGEARGPASVPHAANENNANGADMGDVAPALVPTVSSRPSESSTAGTIETHAARSSDAAAVEQPKQFTENDAAATRPAVATAVIQRDERAVHRDGVAPPARTVAHEPNGETHATSAAAVSEKWVRPLVETAAETTAHGRFDSARIGGYTAGHTAVEKIAAPEMRRERIVGNVGGIAKKEFVSTAYQSVTDQHVSIGTNVAKAEDHMPAPAPIAASAPSIERLSHAVAPASFDAAFADSRGAESSELAQVARRAVNAAMEITEQFATGEKNSVTLKFSISGSELGVRVELRGQQVHTTFRTDSPELRTALAQEWQTVNAAPAADRPSRLAEPVFTSNASTGAAGSDTNGADQRGSQARQGQFASDEWARYRTHSRAADTAPAAVSTPVPRVVNPAAPGRLHTFA